jgi:hypothetical protein
LTKAGDLHETTHISPTVPAALCNGGSSNDTTSTATVTEGTPLVIEQRNHQRHSAKQVEEENRNHLGPKSRSSRAKTKAVHRQFWEEGSWTRIFAVWFLKGFLKGPLAIFSRSAVILIMKPKVFAEKENISTFLLI